MKNVKWFALLLVSLCLISCQPVSIEPGASEPVPVTQMLPALKSLTPTIAVTTPGIVPTMSVTPTLMGISLSPTPVPDFPISPPTPAPIVAWRGIMYLDYQVVWSIPEEWWDISSASPLPSDDILWRQVWADQENAAALLSASPADFPNGLILLTLQVQAGEKSPASFDLSQSNRWGQLFGIVETEGDEASPFDLQLDASIDHLAFHYNLSLDCAVPETAIGQSRDDFITYCRDLWHRVLFNSGLCIIPLAATPAPLTWREVSDVNTHYAFEVPASWSEGTRATADRRSFFSLPVHQQPQKCPFPDHLIKVDFAADPPGNFATEGQPPTQGAPDTEKYIPITVAEYPAWRFDSRGQESAGGNFVADSTTIYIQGPEYWYFFYFACAPVWTADCEDSLSQILESFQILP